MKLEVNIPQGVTAEVLQQLVDRLSKNPQSIKDTPIDLKSVVHCEDCRFWSPPNYRTKEWHCGLYSVRCTTEIGDQWWPRSQRVYPNSRPSRFLAKET